MTDTLQSGPGETQHEGVIRGFELAWQSGTPPALEEYLLAGADSDVLLVELVHVDLEFRIKFGHTARARDYLDRFPQLARIETAVARTGKALAANAVALGAMLALGAPVSRRSLESALLRRIPAGTEALNRAALAAGYDLVRSAG